MPITIQDVMQWEGYMRKCLHELTTDNFYIDEAIQQTYLYLLERADMQGLEFIEWKGKPNISYLRMLSRSQLFYILRTESRRRKRELFVGERWEDYEPPADPDTPPESDEEFRPCHKELIESIESLAPYDRELLKLVYLHKQSQKDISDAANIPYQTLLKDVSEARKKIKKEINKRK